MWRRKLSRVSSENLKYKEESSELLDQKTCSNCRTKLPQKLIILFDAIIESEINTILAWEKSSEFYVRSKIFSTQESLVLRFWITNST